MPIFAPFAFMGSSGYDPDAQNFFTAVESGGDTLTTTEKTAVNNLVIGLKNAGIWSTMTGLYPFVGGTSSSMAWNLADTSQYNITWNNSGNITFNANGIQGDGTSGTYGDTNFNVSASGFNTDHHYSVYSRTDTRWGGGLGWDMGGGNSVNGQPLYGISIGRTAGARIYDFGDFSTGRISLTSGTNDNDGFFMGRSTASNEHKFFKNGSSIGTSTGTPTYGAVNRNMWLMACNGGESMDYSTRNYALFSFGSSMDDTGASDYYTAVQNFQTALSRQV